MGRIGVGVLQSHPALMHTTEKFVPEEVKMASIQW